MELLFAHFQTDSGQERTIDVHACFELLITKTGNSNNNVLAPNSCTRSLADIKPTVFLQLAGKRISDLAHCASHTLLKPYIQGVQMIDTTPAARWVIDTAKCNIPSCREFNSALNKHYLVMISLFRAKLLQKNQDHL